MQTQEVKVDRKQALTLYREYRKHQHYSKPIDKECQRAYQLIAQGRMIIQALESVRLAGVKTDGADAGFPVLGLCRADAVSCRASIGWSGGLTMSADDRQVRRSWRQSRILNPGFVFEWSAEAFPRQTANLRNREGIALVPTPPIHLRPKRGLANYHILWEAEWTKIVPHDPMLLRRIGRGDMWLVVAHWDLTPVERAALSTRL